jgi:hypothetical protein
LRKCGSQSVRVSYSTLRVKAQDPSAKRWPQDGTRDEDGRWRNLPVEVVPRVRKNKAAGKLRQPGMMCQPAG